jgi:hypothetical protein
MPKDTKPVASGRLDSEHRWHVKVAGDSATAEVTGKPWQPLAKVFKIACEALNLPPMVTA